MSGVRIPIRRWSEERSPRDFSRLFELTVEINGELLAVQCSVPDDVRYLSQDGFRDHIVNQVSRRIGNVIADEIRRCIC